MNERDLELIIGLIDRTLPPDDEAAARARLESDAAFAAAYAEQVSVSDTLAGLGPVTMSVDESASLRDSLTQQLALEAAPVATTTPSPGFFARWWKPMSGLAAAAAVVAVIVVPGTIGSGGDSADEVAFTEATAGDAQGEDGADAGSAPSEIAFAPEDLQRIVEVSPTNDKLSVPDLSGASSTELMDATAEDDTQETAEESVEDLGYASRVMVDPADIEACLRLIAPSLPEGTTDVFVLGATEDHGTDRPVVLLGIVGEKGVESTLAVDLSSCDVVELDR